MRIAGSAAFIAIVALLHFFSFAPAGAESSADITILDLHQQIEDKKNQIQSIRSQITAYQQSIRQREQEAASLENEMAILEDHIAAYALDIEASTEELSQIDLEMQQIVLEVSQKEGEILLSKDRLGAILRQLYIDGDKDYLELLLIQPKVSDFFDGMHNLMLTESQLKNSLERIKLLRDELGVHYALLQQSYDKQQNVKNALELQKAQLDESKEAKQQLIVQSLLSKEKFQLMLNEARQEQQEINSDISNLQDAVREKLQLQGSGSVKFAWPVDPSRGISAYFHDPSYPFKNIFEHSAVDIRAYQGTYVRAAEDGYVGRTKDGGKGYSYIMILHDKGFATIYGHISYIMAKEETFVKKGQIIGLSGGTPRTNGAGSFTTGPHLHFEIRVNGVPDDPLKYLP